MQETNHKCMYYNWGGTEVYPSYPKEYGARCEYHNAFFSRNNGKLYPCCPTCRVGELKTEGMLVKELMKGLGKVGNHKRVILKVGTEYANEFRIEEGHECVWIKEVE